MNGDESVFSCIKPAGCPAADVLSPPAPPPAAPSPKPETAPVQASSVNSARNEELEKRLKALEDKAGGYASDNRISGLEKQLSDIARALAELAEKAKREKEALNGAVSRLGAELSLYKTTVEALRAGASDYKRLAALENSIREEASARFASLEALARETARKSALAVETSAADCRRIDRLEEYAARLAVFENRIKSVEDKTARIYECEALGHTLNSAHERMEKNVDEAARKAAEVSAEQRRVFSEMDTVTRQVSHLTALLNQFRSELSFLMPRQQGAAEK
jgi:vacuolar-type H+-ATPase subunit I/STV1